MRAPDKLEIEIPDFALVVLIGATGSGKSTFAAKHFLPTEIISSDHCRGLVSDDETDHAVTGDAFDLVRTIAEKRLKHRKLTVIDATNVRSADRKGWIEVARRWHALPVALVIEPGVNICIERNKTRPDRPFGGQVVQRMVSEVRKGLRGLAREGFRQVWQLNSAESVEAATVTRQPLWTDKRIDAGPFDIIGDVHGCGDELEALLRELGYSVAWSDGADGRQVSVTPPSGRKAVFVGDLVDRGPRTPDVLRIAMHMAEAGSAYVIQGNHDRKLMRWLDGRCQDYTRLAAIHRPTHFGRRRVQSQDKNFPRLVAQPCMAGRRQACRCACRVEGRDDRSRFGGRPGIRALRRNNRRDGRVRSARPSGLGVRISRQSGGRLWSRRHVGDSVGEQHALYRYWLRIWRKAHGS